MIAVEGTISGAFERRLLLNAASCLFEIQKNSLQMRNSRKCGACRVLPAGSPPNPENAENSLAPSLCTNCGKLRDVNCSKPVS